MGGATLGAVGRGVRGGRVGGFRAVHPSLEGRYTLFERSETLFEHFAERELEALLERQDVPPEVDDAPGVLVQEEAVLGCDPEGVGEVLRQLGGALGERFDRL